MFSMKKVKVKSHSRFFPQCVFFAENISESQQSDHLRLYHNNSEWTEKSFIKINSAMTEAMEIPQEIQEEKN